MHIIANKILLSTLLTTSLFLTGCSISDENTKEGVKPVQANTTETEESSGFFGSWFGGDADEVPNVEKTAETKESSGLFDSWFGGDEKDVKDNSKKNLEKNKGIKSAVNKKYSKLTGKQQEIIASIEIDAEAERKKKIEAVKIGNINEKVVAKIAKQTRIEDINVKLEEDLKVLKGQLKSSEQQLARTMEGELVGKVSSLDADIQSKVLSIKSKTKDERVAVITSVEKKISDTQSEVESKLMNEALTTELDRFYRFKENEKKLNQQYIDKLSVTKVGLDKKRKKRLTVMEQNIHAMRQSNQELLIIRVSELERQRISAALVIEKKAKAENKAMIDKLIAKFMSEINTHSKSIKAELAAKEKAALSKVSTKYDAEKSERAIKEREHKVGLNAEIIAAKKSAGSKMRGNLVGERDSKITAIDNSLEKSIRRVYTERKKALSSLESENQGQLKKENGVLQTMYNKNKRDLIQKSKQAKSKITRKARTKEMAILAQEKREISAINKEIDVKIKTDIDAALKL